MSTALFRYGGILTSALIFSRYARVELPWVWLCWVMLVPWLAALDREHTMGAAVRSGALMAMAFAAAVFGWFAEAVVSYTQLPPLLAHGLLIVTGPILQPQFVAFAAVRHAVRVRGGGPVVVGVAAASSWVGVEWLAPHVLGDTLGHGLQPLVAVRQAADIAGAPGLTFAILVVNEAVLVAVTGLWRSRRQVIVGLATAAGLVCMLTGYGVVRLRQLAAVELPAMPLTAALIQADLTDYEGLRRRVGTVEAVRTIVDVHAAMSQHALEREAPGTPVELLVWPETVYPTVFGQPTSPLGSELDAEIVELVDRWNVPLVFGTYTRQGDVEHNAAVLLQPGDVAPVDGAVYRKRRLFPLTEQVPAWLELAFLRKRLPWLGTWRAGDGPPILRLRRSEGTELAIAPLICLDAVDPALALDAARRGADLILTLSNDGWFRNGAGARLHLMVSAFRSIETRLPQLRATNTGISAVITPSGGITASTPAGRPAVLAGRITPGGRGSTLMIRWGNWFGPAACLIAFLLVAATFGRAAAAKNRRVA